MNGKQVFREQPRKAMRLRDYDYSTPGAYFVTICVQNRECLFGRVENESMKLNDAGKMIGHWWMEVSRKFPSIQMDEYVVMPNHFHAVIVLVGADLRVRPGLSLQLGDESEPGGQADKADT
jgi:putative transposase